jgi:hypothetical protein
VNILNLEWDTEGRQCLDTFRVIRDSLSEELSLPVDQACVLQEYVPRQPFPSHDIIIAEVPNTLATIVYDSFDLGYCYSRLYSLIHVLHYYNRRISLPLLPIIFFHFWFFIYSILYYTILYYPILSYPILSYPILSYPILSYPILSYPVLSYPILSHPVLSYPVLSYPVLSCPVISYHILSHPVPSNHILSHHMVHI